MLPQDVVFAATPQRGHRPFFMIHIQLLLSSLSAWCCRNWCAYVVTRTVSCVMEDGVETYIKPDYHRCAWGQCPRVAWVVGTHWIFFFPPFLLLLLPPLTFLSESLFGVTPTVSSPPLSRLLNHHSIHVLTPIFPVPGHWLRRTALICFPGESRSPSIVFGFV